MDISGYLILIILIVLGIGIGIGFFVFLKTYLNRRLKGTGKIRKIPQPLTVIFSILLTISLFCNAMFFAEIISLKKDLSSQKNLSSQTITVTDFNKYQEFAKYRDGLINDTLIGYKVTLKTDEDFECYTGFISEETEKVLRMPMYYIYICYIGEPLEDAQMERRHIYDAEKKSGYSSAGKFESELLIISNSLMTYYEIVTIVKIAPETAEAKANWADIPVFTQSRFIIQDS